MVAFVLRPNSCHRWIAKVKNYNFNVPEVRDSDFKNAFPGIFNFTVEILFISFNLLYDVTIFNIRVEISHFDHSNCKKNGNFFRKMHYEKTS